MEIARLAGIKMIVAVARQFVYDEFIKNYDGCKGGDRKWRNPGGVAVRCGQGEFEFVAVLDVGTDLNREGAVDRTGRSGTHVAQIFRRIGDGHQGIIAAYGQVNAGSFSQSHVFHRQRQLHRFAVIQLAVAVTCRLVFNFIT